jgi:hypothetical protein
LRILPTNGDNALVDDLDFMACLQYAWHINSGYVVTKLKSGQKLKLHKFIAARMGLTGQIDHRDLNTLNNQRENLRVATHSQNKANTSLNVTNTSGIKGVSWDSTAGKWRAQIKVNQVKINLGRFTNILEAKAAYNIAAFKYFGEFARD